MNGKGVARFEDNSLQSLQLVDVLSYHVRNGGEPGGAFTIMSTTGMT